MVVTGLKTNHAFQFDGEPKVATATWRQCTLITREIHRRLTTVLHSTLKLENKGEHSSPEQILIKTRTKYCN